MKAKKTHAKLHSYCNSSAIETFTSIETSENYTLDSSDSDLEGIKPMDLILPSKGNQQD
jgi:hypothetical protein